MCAVFAGKGDEDEVSELFCVVGCADFGDAGECLAAWWSDGREKNPSAA